MLSLIHKRILQGPSMIIDEKNFKHIFEAVQFRQFHKSLQNIKVTLNRAYLDRLEQFLNDLGEAERKLFTLDPTTSCTKIRQSVAYPLACKAFTYILEEGVQTFVEIVENHTLDSLAYALQDLTMPSIQRDFFQGSPKFNCFGSDKPQENLKVADNTIKEVEDEIQNISLNVWANFIPVPHNLPSGSIFTKRNVGPGLGREVAEQENHCLPPSIENGAPVWRWDRSAHQHLSPETPNSKGREFEKLSDTVEDNCECSGM